VKSNNSIHFNLKPAFNVCFVITQLSKPLLCVTYRLSAPSLDTGKFGATSIVAGDLYAYVVSSLFLRGGNGIDAIFGWYIRRRSQN